MAPLIQPENSPLNFPETFTSSSPLETFNLGKRIACHLKKGSIVALIGPLGSGKTCLVKGIAARLNIHEEVTSPTYSIITEYEGTLCNGEFTRIYHIDAFRLRGNDDFSAIGGEEIVYGEGISLIEWSDRIPDFIPSHALRIEIEITGTEERLFRINRGKIDPLEII